MALDKAALKAALKLAFQNAVATNDNFDTVADTFATAIDNYIKNSLSPATAGEHPVTPGKTVIE